MKLRLVQWLVCPECGKGGLRLETTRSETRRVHPGQFTPDEDAIPGVDLDAGEEAEVITGALHCDTCRLAFPIRGGIPRMLPSGAEAGPPSGHRLTTIDTHEPAWEENFRDLSAPLQQRDFLGRLVLDAGCGFGRHVLHAARYGAEVVALDNSVDAVESVWRNCGELTHVHVVQGDLLRPPLAPSTFDIVYSFGVLHHLEDPQAAFRSLGTLVRPGGRLALWVYGPRAGITRHVSNALRGLTTNMEPDELMRFSTWIARGLRVFSHTPYRFLGQVPVASEIVSHLPVHDHHQWPFDVVVADVYDRLRIPVRHWFTGEEVERWLTESGYADVHVAGRVRNNETFRAIGTRR